jgi:hypothetical protein
VAPGENEVSFFVRAEGQQFQYAEKHEGIAAFAGRFTKTSSDTSGCVKRGSQFIAYRIVVYILNQKEIDLSWSRDGVITFLYHGEVLSKAPLDFALVTSRKLPSDLLNFGALGLEITVRNEPYVLDALAQLEVWVKTSTYGSLRTVISKPKAPKFKRSLGSLRDVTSAKSRGALLKTSP